MPGAIEFTASSHSDNRGLFWETFRVDQFATFTGRGFPVAQVNTSVSRQGVLRGIHFAEVPPGQAKYVTVSRGSIWDVVVDLRVGSRTFGQWDSVELSSADSRALFIPEGLGHAFIALEDDTSVTYLVSDVYRPEHEHAVNPFDPELGIEWPIDRDQITLSPKDALAPSLGETLQSDLLPTMEDCNERYRELAWRNTR